MIQLLDDVPGNVAGFRALGKVTKADYDHTVIPRIDQTVRKEGKINFMLVLDTSLANFTIGAIIDDLAVGLKHFTKWHKMAIEHHQNNPDTDPEPIFVCTNKTQILF